MKKAGAAQAILRPRLGTGRTYRILFHLAAIGHPVYADPLYGKPVEGERLAFVHPVSGEPLTFEAGIPEDLRASAAALGF